MGGVVPDRGPLLLQRAVLEAAVREPSSVFLPLPVPARQLCAAGISELPYGCRGPETVPDAGLDRPFPLFEGARAILQTSSFGTDFRHHPQTANKALSNTPIPQHLSERVRLSAVGGTGCSDEPATQPRPRLGCGKPISASMQCEREGDSDILLWLDCW